MSELKKGYVYIVTTTLLFKTGAYKIGFAEDYQSRIKQLNTASPDDFKIVLLMYSSNYQELERQLHVLFEGQKINREFYNLSSSDFDKITLRYNNLVTFLDKNLVTVKTEHHPKKNQFDFMNDLRTLFEYVGEKIPFPLLKKQLMSMGYDSYEIKHLLNKEDVKGNMMYIIQSDEWMLLKQ